MRPAPIALATSRNARELSTEDDVLIDCLRVLGAPIDLVDWDDEDYPWRNAALVVIRTTWDYHLRFEEFMAWLSRVEESTPIVNSPALIRWNADKRYLLELNEKGVLTVRTRLLESEEDFEALHSEPWASLVLKPAISAGAYQTLVFEREEDKWGENARAHALRLLERGAVLAQPYLSGIAVDGETSLVFFDGVFHHAVRKTPKSGEFRVQVEFGGKYQLVDPSDAQLELGEASLAALPVVPTYARVDMVGPPELPCLMELELIEPELFFHWAPEAAVNFADLLRELRSEYAL